jgi:hypothetical protein
MIEEIGESIDVVAAFSAGKISPLLFSWRNRRYNNLKVTSMWNEKGGDSKLVHILVTNESANLYELCFSTRYYNWSLVKINHD